MKVPVPNDYLIILKQKKTVWYYLFIYLFCSFRTRQICHGQDFFLAVRKPQGDCPTNELDTLRPSSEYIVATTTVLPGQTNTDIGVEIIVTGRASRSYIDKTLL